MTPRIPEQCRGCLNMTVSTGLCTLYEQLPGEYGREDVLSCPSYLDAAKDDQLTILAKYIDDDTDGIVSQALERAVNKIMGGYQEKFKIMVVGVARRKIKAIIRMVDVIDNLLDKLSSTEELQNMTANQSLRLLSELNASVNSDLSFIMKLIEPDSTFKDIQTFIDARQINVNGASPATNATADQILQLSSTSRDKIRDAFDMLLRNIEPDSSSPVTLPEEEVREVMEGGDV